MATNATRVHRVRVSIFGGDNLQQTHKIIKSSLYDQTDENVLEIRNFTFTLIMTCEFVSSKSL